MCTLQADTESDKLTQSTSKPSEAAVLSYQDMWMKEKLIIFPAECSNFAYLNEVAWISDL